MGYSITIGNATVESGKDYNELWARWVVEYRVADAAPTFPNDVVTGNSNTRSPSYLVWERFCTQSGLTDLFRNEETGLLREHPGCFPIVPKHVEAVSAALERYRATTTLPPGFNVEGIYNQDTQQWGPPLDDGKYDAILARLIWLEWWMRWALKNCETPAIQNT